MCFLKNEERNINGVNYSIKGKIGEGYYSKVYSATDEYYNSVVIKVLNRDRYVIFDEMLKEGKKEFNKLWLLRHPNISYIYHAIIHDNNKIVLIMEKADCNLKNYIEEKGPFSEKEFYEFARQIIQALDFCHNKGVIHRDITYNNVLVFKEGNRIKYKLSDFGISENFFNDDITENPNLYVNFPVPEIMLGDHNVKKNKIIKTFLQKSEKYYYGKQSDIFQLGLLFLYVLTGEILTQGKSRREIKELIVTEQFRKRALTLGGWLGNYVGAFLFNDRNLRYSDVKMAWYELCAYLDHNKISRF